MKPTIKTKNNRHTILSFTDTIVQVESNSNSQSLLNHTKEKPNWRISELKDKKDRAFGFFFFFASFFLFLPKEKEKSGTDGPDIFRYKYTGQEEDRETGLYYYKARYYEPELARFIQPDTVMNPNTPFGMNLYMYVEGNPVMYRDPSGHKKLKALKSWNVGKAIGNSVKILGTNIGQGAKALLGQRETNPNKYGIDLGKAWDRAIGQPIKQLGSLNLRRSWAGRRWGKGPHCWQGNKCDPYADKIDNLSNTL